MRDLTAPLCQRPAHFNDIRLRQGSDSDLSLSPGSLRDRSGIQTLQQMVNSPSFYSIQFIFFKGRPSFLIAGGVESDAGNHRQSPIEPVRAWAQLLAVPLATDSSRNSSTRNSHDASRRSELTATPRPRPHPPQQGVGWLCPLVPNRGLTPLSFTAELALCLQPRDPPPRT